GSRAAHPWSGPGRRSTDGRALPGLPWGPDWVRPVILAHLDLDAFLAAVEELEQPELRSKPLVVGGDPHGRGVVATANYEARKFGIHSAMAAAEALRRCPHVVFVRPRHTLYREYSQAVWAEGRLSRSGVETIGALAALPDGELRRLLPGKLGPLLRDRARGIDPRPLETTSETISISTEETFDRDIADVEQLKAEVRRMAERVAERLGKGSQTARTGTTKVRYPDFSIRSRSTTLPVGTDDSGRIAELACALLDRALTDRPGALRLVGVGVSGLEDHRQLALLG